MLQKYYKGIIANPGTNVNTLREKVEKSGQEVKAPYPLCSFLCFVFPYGRNVTALQGVR